MITRYTRKEMGEIWSKKNRIKRWLEVEIAVLQAQEELGLIPIITPDIRTKMESVNIAEFQKRTEEIEKSTQHDVKAFVEACNEWLPERAKPYFHAGLTSYDIVDTTLALILKESIRLLEKDNAQLNQVLEKRAQEHKETIMVGRTHGMHAEPITFGFKLLNWLDEMQSHRQRFECLENIIAVGKISGVVGIYTLPPRVEEIACQKLGLKPAKISTQIISRDRHAEYVFTLALIAGSLDKFATEIRNLQRPEIAEVEEPFVEGQVGSSAMPHKRNPHKSENLSSLARLFRGWVVTALENQNTWHERDLANSANERVILADSSITLDFMLWRFTKIIEELRVYPERMMDNLESTGGLIYSQNIMQALTNKGLGREEAYQLVQGLAAKAQQYQEPRSFKALVMYKSKIGKILSQGEIIPCFDPKQNLKYIDEVFARFGL